MSKEYQIIILGNNMAGVGAAQYLLKHTIPALKAIKPTQAYHVTIVGPSKKVFYKICAPRVIVAPDLISIDQMAFPMEEQFAKYSKEEFTWVQGLATGLDENAKQVTVTSADNSTQTIAYDSLIVATGSKLDPLWASNDDFSATQNSFDAMHKAFPHAKKVLIAGGGPVGVETAGEIMAKYPQMKVTLVSGTTRVLSALSVHTSQKAERMLANKGVLVVNNKKVVAPTTSSASATTVKFDDGTSQDVDIYIHAIGGGPNTSFLPPAWLDERRKVKVEYETLRGPVPDVYALGDVASNSNSTFMDLQFGWGPCMSAVAQDLAAKLNAKDKRSGPFRERKFKRMEDTQFVPIGRGGGVAQLLGWGLPSFVVWFVKARTFFVEKAKAQFDGQAYAKA